MIELGGDVACVQIDHDALHLQDIGGTRLTGFRHRAGNDIDRRSLARAPGGEGGELVGRRAVRVDPDVVGPAVLALTLVHEAADRDQSLGIAEDHVDEARDLRGIRFHGEGIGQRCRVVEIPPWIEVDDLVVAHTANPQHRSAWAQNRHSKKSRLAAMRGSSSPASVACRIRTARSDMRCARSASKATCS